MNSKARKLFNDWLKTRPLCVRQMARRFPPGTRFNMHGQIVHVISYDEYTDGTAGVCVTPFDPGDDYEAAVNARQPVCSCCLDKLDSLKVEP